MSYDYNFPESMRIAEINNNRKVGTVPRRFIQSGNNVASGFARPEFPLGSPAMGGEAISGGKRQAKTLYASDSFKRMVGQGGKVKRIAKGTASGIKMLATDPVGFTNVLVGPPTSSSNFQGDPNNPFGGKIKGSKVLKSVGKVVVPIVTKAATKALEKALTDMIKSGVEAEGAGMCGGKKGAKAFAKSVMSSPVTKAVAKEAFDIALPVVKKVATDMAKDLIKGLMSGESEPAGGKAKGPGAKKFFTRTGDKVVDAGIGVGTAAGTAYLLQALANPAVLEAAATTALPIAETVALTAAEGAGMMKRGRGRPRKIPIYGANPPTRSMSASGGSARGKKNREVVFGSGGALPPRPIIYGANPITRPMRGGADSGGQMIYGADPRTFTPRRIGGMAPSGGAKGMSRQMMVSKIMRERGVSLPEASSIVKREGLY